MKKRNESGRSFIRFLTLTAFILLLVGCCSSMTFAKTGFVNKNGKWYYYDKSGQLVKGWYTTKGGNKYFFKKTNGAAVSGIKTVGKHTYIFTEKGMAQKGFVVYDGNLYFCDMNTCRMAKGWYKSAAGNPYYFDPETGIVEGGVKLIDGKYYLLNVKGKVQKGWCTFGENRYYAGNDYVLVTGWQTFDGEQYYFDEYGALQTLTWIDGTMFVDRNGIYRPNATDDFHEIMGPSTVSAAKMAAFYKQQGMTYPKSLITKSVTGIEDFCEIIYSEAAAEGVKAEILFSQIMLETGWLQFGGDVGSGQFNFGGIGAVGGGAAGNQFTSIRSGIRAQVQHLKAYASTEPLKKECIDPRFTYVVRGCARWVEFLGIQENPEHLGWASSPGYGYEILSVWGDLTGLGYEKPEYL